MSLVIVLKINLPRVKKKNSAEAYGETAPSFGPLIGVLAQPLDSGVSGSYIQAWYIKWLEAVGARIIPLRYDAPVNETNTLLERVHGILFPGGGAHIDEASSDYGRFGASVFHAAWKIRMPMWGTCLGFEQMMLYSSGATWPGPLTDGWDAEELFLPLNLTADVASLLSNWPAALRQEIAGNPWTWHMHQFGVSPEAFTQLPQLQKSWQVLATNRDRRGKEFVSLVEARGGFPFFASQFHPEKNAYEFEIPANTSIDGSLPVHSAAAVDAMSRFAFAFIDRAHNFRNFGFTQDEFWKWSIAQWPMTLAGNLKGADWLPKHMQVFYFPPWNISFASNSSQQETRIIV